MCVCLVEKLLEELIVILSSYKIFYNLIDVDIVKWVICVIEIEEYYVKILIEEWEFL